MKIYLIRHGQTDWNIEGKIQGRQDISLNQTGRKQAEDLAAGMDTRPVTQIFSSIQKRARETALVLGQRQNVDVRIVSGLEEVDFGQWEGLTWSEIQTQYPREYERWSLNPVEAAPPGGESQLAVWKRCADAVKLILSEAEGDIAIVSHGATLAHLISYFLQGKSEDFEIIVENASITTMNYSLVTQDFMLLEVNDTRHLSGM